MKNRWCILGRAWQCAEELVGDGDRGWERLGDENWKHVVPLSEPERTHILQGIATTAPKRCENASVQGERCHGRNFG